MNTTMSTTMRITQMVDRVVKYIRVAFPKSAMALDLPKDADLREYVDSVLFGFYDTAIATNNAMRIAGALVQSYHAVCVLRDFECEDRWVYDMNYDVLKKYLIGGGIEFDFEVITAWIADYESDRLDMPYRHRCIIGAFRAHIKSLLEL